MSDEFWSTRRKYKRGYQPRFKFGFYDNPTIYDTGRGSADRSNTKQRKSGILTYDEIKQQCVDEGSLWEDPDFPAEDSSLFFKEPPSCGPGVTWKRPSEICDDPQMFVDGATRMDVNQGILGDCWLLAAVASLSTNQALLNKVVLPQQSFSDDYAGIFKFNFWQYGRWVEVCIDDRLPVDDNDKLLYMHSDERNEFWTAFIEKAYAKLCGSYESLSGGLTSEALTDFTGGMVERFDLKAEETANVLSRMLNGQRLGALMGCSIDADPNQLEARLDNGLIMGHAYSITDVRKVEINTPRTSGVVPMVRVRNPWGDSHEWRGRFSDDSEEWSLIPDEEKEEMGLNFSHDGEFWMMFEDFRTEFGRLEICMLGPDSRATDGDTLGADIESEIGRWNGALHESGWKRNVNAGGCRNFGSFYTNPQFIIEIDEPDEDDEDGKTCVVIAVMQKERRKMRKEGQDNHAVGYAVYKIGEEYDAENTMSRRFFDTHNMDAKSPFINLREVCGHHLLEPGKYVILPSTFNPNEEAFFILRIFSEKPRSAIEVDTETSCDHNIKGENGEEFLEDDDTDIEKDEMGRKFFREVAGDDGEVDAWELKDILNQCYTGEFEFDGFSTDMCRGMIAMKDADYSGRLDFKDYKSLFNDLKLCRKVFKSLDADGSGFFSSFEFRRAVNSLGMRVSNATFNAMVMRYSNREGQVRFDDFVACIIKLKTVFASFKRRDDADDDEEVGKFSLDEFIQLCMYS